jgi:hypothetical protein
MRNSTLLVRTWFARLTGSDLCAALSQANLAALSLATCPASRRARVLCVRRPGLASPAGPGWESPFGPAWPAKQVRQLVHFAPPRPLQFHYRPCSSGPGGGAAVPGAGRRPWRQQEGRVRRPWALAPLAPAGPALPATCWVREGRVSYWAAGARSASSTQHRFPSSQAAPLVTAPARGNASPRRPYRAGVRSLKRPCLVLPYTRRELAERSALGGGPVKRPAVPRASPRPEGFGGLRHAQTHILKHSK